MTPQSSNHPKSIFHYIYCIKCNLGGRTITISSYLLHKIEFGRPNSLFHYTLCKRTRAERKNINIPLYLLQKRMCGIQKYQYSIILVTKANVRDTKIAIFHYTCCKRECAEHKIMACRQSASHAQDNNMEISYKYHGNIMEIHQFEAK